jgi:methionyl-tRNA formyltransferase
MSVLRIAFLGQNVADCLEPLKALHARFGIAAVVESAPRGFDVDHFGGVRRAEQTRRSKLMRLARRENVPYFLFTNVRTDELAAFLAYQRIDLMCVASMSGLLREPALGVPTLGTLGYHPSMLPKYRGPNPWFWQYYFMEREGGVSIFFLDAGEDSGDIAQQEPFSISLGLPFSGLHQRCVEVGTRLFIQAVEAILANRCSRMVQRHLLCPFRARGVARNEPLIEWKSWPLLRIWHVLRGTTKWLDAIDTKRIPICKAWRVGEMELRPSCLEPGVVGEDADGYFVAHNEGRIRIYVS